MTNLDLSNDGSHVRSEPEGGQSLQMRLSDFIPWDGIVKWVLTIVALVLVVLNWNPLTSALASALKQSIAGVNSEPNALVIANYLLVALIIATIGVELIPFLLAGSIDQRLA